VARNTLFSVATCPYPLGVRGRETLLLSPQELRVLAGLGDDSPIFEHGWRWALGLKRPPVPDEQAYRDQKYEVLRPWMIFAAAMGCISGVGFWAWDWTIDPVGAANTVGLRLVMGLLALPILGYYVAGAHRGGAAWVGILSVAGLDVCFSLILERLDGGFPVGVGGYLYFFIMGPLTGIGYGIIQLSIVAVVMAVTPVVVHLIGLAPNLPLGIYTATIVPAAGIMISIAVVFDNLARRAYCYRLAIEALATRDPLTGVSNRRHFLQEGRRHLALSRRHGHPLSVVMIDVDRLKFVNDHYGHNAGDAVLIHTVKAVRGVLRHTDEFARIGGDEFAVLAPMTTADQAANLAERIRETLALDPVDLPDPVRAVDNVFVSVSMGVAENSMVPEDGDFGDLLKWADKGAYVAKRKGRNRVATGEVTELPQVFGPGSG